MALFAQWTQFASERAFYRYAWRHPRPLFPLFPLFPRLPERSQFNRQLGRQVPHLLAVGWAVARRIEQQIRAPRRAGESCP